MLWRVGEGDAYALLEGLLGQCAGLAGLPRVSRGAGGKPYFPDLEELHFSVSRSGGLALCAVGRYPVGADVERVRPRSPGFPQYALGRREYDWYRSRGGRWEDFYTLWTLKEARVKCTGQGLSHCPVREVTTPLLTPGETEVWEGFRFTALAGEDWRGAVCEQEKGPASPL